MTKHELYSLYELKGRLEGRKVCLESDITSVKVLYGSLVTEVYQARAEGRLVILERWEKDNARLLEEVNRIIKEAENARE